ncbi:MAG: HEAT repeat domain-containing protein [Candidatus Eisenbacteria bacterium]
METDINLQRAQKAQDSKVEAILNQMVLVLRDMRAYEPENPEIRKSLRTCLAQLTPFLQQNASLTLLVEENALVYGEEVVYSCAEKLDSLAFVLYRDGIRLITFRSGVGADEIEAFTRAVHDARGTDPHQADLVTMLWEKDLAHITYRAVDTYLDAGARERIEGLVNRSSRPDLGWDYGDVVLSRDFFVNQLGLSPPQSETESGPDPKAIGKADVKTLVYEMLEENEQVLLKRCTEICFEIARTAGNDEMFDAVVGFLGTACEWLVASGDFNSACSIVSGLRSFEGATDLSTEKRAVVVDNIGRLGEKRRIIQVADHFDHLTESRVEEIFSYLKLMAPVAVGPLCELLADSEDRAVRYLLCRAISIIGCEDEERMRRYILDSRWYVVRNMVLIMGMTGRPEMIPVLQQASAHSEPRVRRELARALGRIKSPEGIEILRTQLEDDVKQVRSAALTAIRDIGGDTASTVLYDTIKDKDFRKRPLDERKDMMTVYGSLGRGSFELLRSILDGKVHRWDKKTRACAAYGLAMIGDDESVELLRTSAGKGRGPMRHAASDALVGLERGRDLR